MSKEMLIKDCPVYGLQLNPQTGCLHYASALDIVAIKFKCCKRYYACHFCHQAMADHPPECWHIGDFHIKAILCGCCGIEMTIHQYLSCNNKCPHCHSPFNPGCRLHWTNYFSTFPTSV